MSYQPQSGPPQGLPGAAPMGGPMDGGGAPPEGVGQQFPSADPQAILALLSQLQAHDQMTLVASQQQAAGGALAAMLQNAPNPNAAAAQTAPGGPAAPSPDTVGQGGYGG